MKDVSIDKIEKAHKNGQFFCATFHRGQVLRLRILTGPYWASVGLVDVVACEDSRVQLYVRQHNRTDWFAIHKDSLVCERLPTRRYLAEYVA